ncbi:MAG: glycine--tRNA ligase subunit beta [Actinobacteria bacterium]|nr:glycine--tRNA ligase subunit beta [Actinomycetota bacterium]
MPKLLFEIGCEELPAAACMEAGLQLPELSRAHLGASPEELFIGPRRLAFPVTVAEHTDDEWIKGPPEALREKAAPGFAKRYGVAVDDLTLRDGFLGLEVPGRPIAEVLPERLAEIVRGLQFGKSMTWGAGFRFARPVRWLCAVLDGEPISVALEGVPSGGLSYGHRTSHPGPVEIPSAEGYLEALRAAGVEPDRAVRYEQIVAGLDALGPWRDPSGKLDEVVYLVEAARVQEASFDERFLELPARVIVTTMQAHQRYFPLGGNRFAFVANGGDPAVVRAGNEFVLSGRLEDAEFTFRRDVEVGIEGLADRLGAITYIAGAGTYAEKTERLVSLVGELGGDADARRAATLAKADLASELVREFTELQGYIGAEYARRAGESESVAAAIEEQYFPDSAGGPLPRTPQGAALAAADKLDHLTTAFGLGTRPTGSRDPFGLRRAAIGLNRLAIDGNVPVQRASLGPAQEFVEERLEGLLNVPVEFVRAARASAVGGLGEVARLAQALHAAERGEAFGAVYEAYDRANRLVGKRDDAAEHLDESLFEHDTERELAAAIGKLELDPADFDSALANAATVAPVVARFFDDVMVIAEDDRVRGNRVRLLLDVRDELGRLGDFSQIPGS